ncbi:CBS domain-containing protein, partial [Candidatus Saccharibacteria bacterium]|nr:CBS domain-containing protein [Candidatus Saccharibacteria bacterium]
RMIRAMLGFGDKKIRDVMTPRRMVQTVTKDDEIGPVLMDELHKSGHSRFPVISEPKHYNFVGTLYLRDLIGELHSKKVKDLMSPQVFYVHEEESLDHALRAFLKTKHHLFIVVNNFEEFVGVLSIEDVIEAIIGKEIVDEFDQHDNLRAVAQSIAEKERKIHDSAINKPDK